jgi:photosystem II stability/assembly factor-like uncharacterized protein
VYAGDIGRLYKSANGGLTWDTLRAGTSIADILIHPTNPNIVYVVGIGLSKTTDGGTTWAKTDSGISWGEGGIAGTLAMDPQHPDTLYTGFADVAVGRFAFYKTTNGGVYWRDMGAPDGVQVIAVNSWKTNELWKGDGSAYIKVSRDGGESWSGRLPLEPDGIVYSIAFGSLGAAVYVGRAWTFSGPLSFASTTDGGLTWQGRTDGLPDATGVRKIQVKAGPLGDQFFIAARGQVFEAGSDLHWERIGIDGQYVTTIALAGDMLYAGGKGIYAMQLVSSTRDQRPIPNSVVLYQNYPNPFNPSTTIKFELPRASLVNLSVFDILGRELSVPVNDRRDAGVYDVKFDGSNLASGVYFYRLLVGDFVQTKKLMVLK